MNYQEAIHYIESLALNAEKRPGLERIETFLSCHGCPQNAFKAMHVGGTNGKGSTVAMLDTIFRAGGFKTARFTGPHLLRVNERFHIDGEAIADDELAQYVSQLKKKSDHFAEQYPQFGSLSWFEFLTALAFFYFADHSVDIAAIEVGLGGRYDATNVLQKLYATGITNIAFDHERILGSTLEEIAAEKAGIIKRNIPVVTGASGAALNILSEQANQLGSQLITCNSNPTINGSLEQIKNDILLHGLYQYNNALMALYMVSGADLLEYNGAKNIDQKTISMEKALHGLRNFYWPGRLQIIESQHLILDCAHNPAGIQSLRNSLDHLMPNQDFQFVFACYADKDGLAMLKTLTKPGDHLYLGEFTGKRQFFSNISLAKFAQDLGVATSIHSTLAEALAEAKAKRKQNQFIVVTGSFSAITTIMQTLGWKSIEDGLN